MRRLPRAAHGFTLVEVLVAIIILLFGVVMALRIFPRGFDAFTESQQAQTSYKLLDQLAREFQEHPETLPDGIYPADTGSADADAAAAYFDFNNLYAIDYQATGTAASFSWFNRHLFPSVLRGADGSVQREVGRWPLWQPASVRVPRRVVGEKCPIPSGRAADVIDVVLATVNADAAQGATQLTVDDTSKILHGMWLAVDDPASPTTLIDMLVQVHFDPANPNKEIADPLSTPTVELIDDLPALVPNGAKLRLFAPSAFLPRYQPRFGPIIPNGEWNGATSRYEWANDGVNDTPLTIYDVRFQKVSFAELERARDATSAPESAPSVYVLANTASARQDTTYCNALYFLPEMAERSVRISFFCRDMTTANTTEQVSAQLITFPRQGDPPQDLTVTTSDGTDIDITLESVADYCRMLVRNTSNWRIISGSEQINRAYQYYNAIQPQEDPSCVDFYDPAAVPDQDTRRRIYYTKLANLPSGSYFLERMNVSAARGLVVPGTIYFSRQDGGRQVKVDYTVADWGALREELAVGQDGYLTLALPDPKVQQRPIFPREPVTWGLYGPFDRALLEGWGQLQASNRLAELETLRQACVVMALVDTRTDMVYHVTYRIGDRTHPYGLDPQSGIPLTNQAIAVDLSQAARGRIRLGAVPAGVTWTGGWSDATAQYTKDTAVQHHGLPFVCVQDHTPTTLVDDEPGIGANWTQYWEVLDNPDWDRLRGATFRVFYRARRDWTLQVYKPPTVFWYMKPTGNPAAMALRWSAFTSDISGNNAARQTIYVPSVYQGQSVAVDYFRRIDDPVNPSDRRLVLVSGEMHVVPAKEQASHTNSRILLKFPPALNTIPTVRGASVTVRALWVQPRGGPAYTVVDGAAPDDLPERALNERWQARTLTIALPPTKD